ncbi:hypothetical protein [Herbaspirillum sp. RV1423]|uniref:hypothetical protein n=1 Tax=Herbaspirillum sp. RV1423 TaxID=1443993 RepID=UPI0004B351A5|nr:hypothetical protein [Herbaspirillum sp. RV1423]
MSARPSSPAVDPNADAPLDPAHEYEESTETKLDHTRPPHHEQAAGILKKHKDEPQISIGDD